MNVDTLLFIVRMILRVLLVCVAMVVVGWVAYGYFDIFFGKRGAEISERARAQEALCEPYRLSPVGDLPMDCYRYYNL